MIDLRRALTTAIKNHCDRVYYDTAPEKVQFPYVVFSFPAEGRQYKGQVEKLVFVQIFDVEKSGYNVAEQLENLTDNVDHELDYIAFQEGTTQMWARRVNRIKIPFPQDSKIWGRELQYELRTYKGV